MLDRPGARPAGSRPAHALRPQRGARAVRRAAARGVGDLTGRFPLVVVHPGGASNPGMVMPQKRWPAPRFATLADRIVEETGARILVVGHGADQPLARQMRFSMRHQAVDLVGQTTPGQLAALVQRSHLFIGNNSLPLHLAVSVGTPVLGMFGPTDPAINGPYNAVGLGLVHPDACSQHRAFVPGPVSACPGCRCIELISVDAAWEAAARLLQGAASRRARTGSPDAVAHREAGGAGCHRFHRLLQGGAALQHPRPGGRRGGRDPHRGGAALRHPPDVQRSHPPPGVLRISTLSRPISAAPTWRSGPRRMCSWSVRRRRPPWPVWRPARLRTCSPCTALATRAPLVIAPAMNVNMWQHPATQANVATLRERGAVQVGPVGRAPGRGDQRRGDAWPPLEDVLAGVRLALGRSAAWTGRRVVVTAGGTPGAPRSGAPTWGTARREDGLRHRRGGAGPWELPGDPGSPGIPVLARSLGGRACAGRRRRGRCWMRSSPRGDGADALGDGGGRRRLPPGVGGRAEDQEVGRRRGPRSAPGAEPRTSWVAGAPRVTESPW